MFIYCWASSFFTRLGGDRFRLDCFGAQKNDSTQTKGSLKNWFYSGQLMQSKLLFLKGAIPLSLMTFSITTLSIMTFSIAKLSITTLSITTLSITTLRTMIIIVYTLIGPNTVPINKSLKTLNLSGIWSRQKLAYFCLLVDETVCHEMIIDKMSV